jgi:acetyltransferase-like isoleucine patch superfamily enzyme
MKPLELLWWAGWAYFVACAAAPLALVRHAGPIAGAVVWAVLAPWTALAGMALLHRLLPGSEAGKFRLPDDAGSIRWAMKGWAPSVYLTVFQPLFFLSPGFQRLVLRAFGARLGAGAWLTSRTIVREPHRLRVGRDTLIGEHAHLVCSYQPRPSVLVVDAIDIGDEVLVGAYSVLAPGVRIGSRSILEHQVNVAAHVTIGEGTRIGAGSCIYNAARVGSNVSIGKHCIILAGSVIPDGTAVPHGATV